MVALPAATPVTTPVEPTVATAVLPLLHVPPPVELLKGVVNPAQTTAVPVIEDGNELMLIVEVARQPVDNV